MSSKEADLPEEYGQPTAKHQSWPRPLRLAVVTSHPIQYQAPLFLRLAETSNISLEVFFCSAKGAKVYDDRGFGQEIQWDIPLLSGYYSHFLPNVSPFRHLDHPTGVLNPTVVTAIRSGEFDAIWIHGWNTSTAWLATLAASIAGIPFILRGETNLLAPLPPWKEFLRRLVLKSLFRKAAALLSVGSYNTEFYEAYDVPKTKIFMTPYSVDNERLARAHRALRPIRMSIRRDLGLPPDLPVLLFMGKLTRAKRPMDLLRAYEVCRESVEASLVFVGDGPMRRGIADYCRSHRLDRVFLEGFRNQSIIPKYYEAADIFVLPSGFEPWGLVVNEAMCFGLPVVVSSKVGAAGDLVRNGLNGFVYPAGEVDALANGLKLLLQNPALRDRMGGASAEIISQWSFDQDVEGILKCLGAVFKFESAKKGSPSQRTSM